MNNNFLSANALRVNFDRRLVNYVIYCQEQKIELGALLKEFLQIKMEN